MLTKMICKGFFVIQFFPLFFVDFLVRLDLSIIKICQGLAIMLRSLDSIASFSKRSGHSSSSKAIKEYSV